MRRSIAFVLAALATPLVRAQQPIFRGGVDYVSVDAIVTDASDRPVTGLTAEDFEISELGKPQRIADFRYVAIPVATRTIDSAHPIPPTIDVTSNTPPSPSSRVFVIVIDDLHLIESQIVPI